MSESEAAFLTDVGLRVRLLRTARALSQDRLAELAGVSRVTLGSIERGEHEAGIGRYRLLAHALDVPLSVLVEDGDDLNLLVRTLAHQKMTSRQPALPLGVSPAATASSSDGPR